MEDMMGGGEEMSMMEDMMMDMGGTGETAASGSGRLFNSENSISVCVPPRLWIMQILNLLWAGSLQCEVVPHRELYEAYKQALQDADQYDQDADTPFYYDLQVQRADVTDKSADQLVEADWVKVWDRTLYTKLATYNWSGFAPEIVPNDYRDEALTMWIPPVLLDDYRSIARHPLIPEMSQAAIKQEQGNVVEDEEVKQFSMEMEDDTELVAPGQRATGGMGGEGWHGHGYGYGNGHGHGYGHGHGRRNDDGHGHGDDGPWRSRRRSCRLQIDPIL